MPDKKPQVYEIFKGIYNLAEISFQVGNCLITISTMLFLANFSERLLYRFIWIQRGSLHYLKHFECSCSDFSFYILPSFFWWNLLFFKVCLAKKIRERQEKTHNPVADVFCNSSLLRTQHQLHPGPQQSNSLQMLTKLAECWASHWSLVKIYSTKKKF